MIAAYRRHMERLNGVEEGNLTELELLLIRDGVLLRLMMQSIIEYYQNRLYGKAADYGEVEKARETELRLLREEIFPKLGIDPDEMD